MAKCLIATRLYKCMSREAAFDCEFISVLQIKKITDIFRHRSGGLKST